MSPRQSRRSTKPVSPEEGGDDKKVHPLLVIVLLIVGLVLAATPLRDFASMLLEPWFYIITVGVPAAIIVSLLLLSRVLGYFDE